MRSLRLPLFLLAPVTARAFRYAPLVPFVGVIAPHGTSDVPRGAIEAVKPDPRGR
jgi:hypothetical protein